jgi:predicted transglutaminase-like cysteine proteinase
MGKGQIISDQGNGIYRVKIIYGGRDKLNARIAALDVQIADLQTRIDAESDEYQKSLLKLEKSALEKSKQYLENAFPDDYEVDMHCADFTEGLTGDVGTIEVPGEDQFFNIQPGHDNNAVYSGERDGQLWPAVAGSGDWSFFNQCILPGWQKWMPTYRYAQIVDLAPGSNTCRIEILPFSSSQQSLDINQGEKSFGSGETNYLYTDRSHTGWDDFKSNNPSHPLCTNTEAPETLASTDELVNQIWAIDEEVNSKHLYKSDSSYRKVSDYWAIMAGDDPNPLLNEKGDCEDFALTKADKLITDLGLSAKNMQIALCYTRNGDYHANLLVPTTGHGTLVLDINLIGRKTKSQLDAIGWYSWDLFLTTGGEDTYMWADYSVEVFDVEIEYMDCNAGAFAVGDTVLVEFEGQDWSQPKVVGFKENPVDCGLWFYKVLGTAVGQYGIYSSRLNMITKAEESNIPPPSIHPNRAHASAAPIANGLLTVGGSYGYDHYKDTTLVQGKASIPKTDYPENGRHWLNSFNLSEKVYACGGWKFDPPTNSYFKTNYEFDLAGDTWTKKTSLPNEINGQNGVEIGGKGYVTGHGRLAQQQCYPQPSNYVSWEGYGNFVTGFQGRNYEYSQEGNVWTTKMPTDDPQWSQGRAATDTEAFHIGGDCHYDHVEVNPNWVVCSMYTGCGGYKGACVSPPNPFPALDQIVEDSASTQGITAYNPATNSWRVAGNVNDFSAPSQYSGTQYDMSATVSGRDYVVADAHENKVYFFTRCINGHGIIEFNPVTEAFDLYTTVTGGASAFVWNSKATGGIVG